MKSERVDILVCVFECCMLNAKKVLSFNKFRKMPLKQMSFRVKPLYFERDGPVCTRSASSFCRNPSYDPHNMCAIFERITAKTGCTSFTNWTISFKVQGFHTKTHLLQRHFIFLSLFQLKTFFASNMQHSKPHTENSTLSDFICYFSCI